MRARRPAFAATSLLLGTLLGCQGGYVWKQAMGQWALSGRQEPIDDLEVRSSLTASRLERLDWIPRILEFAREELALDPGDSYTTFLETRGEPISHVIVASHPRALAAHRWCFPFVGCVPYKGFFDRSDAEREAEELRRSGEDVGVYEVEAFSTLGWFQDPVLSTMLDRSLPDLASLLIHETVHRTLYVPDNATFNESLATLVARVGTELFLDTHPGAATAGEREAWATRAELLSQDAIIVESLTRELEALYRSGRPDEVVDARKAEMLATARRARSLLLGAEVTAPASNADVLASATYHGLIPALNAKLEKLGGHPRSLMAYFQEIRDRGDPLPEPFGASTSPARDRAPAAQPRE